jgi:glycosyltransferase involved in cell wall biosynthesis
MVWKPLDYNGGMSLSIAMNARILHHPPGGVRRYAGEAARRLGDQVTLLSEENAARGLKGHIWEQFVLPRKVQASDILWSPANTGPLGVKNQVVTIHDLSPLDQPQGFKPQFRLWYRILLPQLARRVRAIITDSEFSRGKIISRLGVNPEKVHAIALGVDQAHFSPRDAHEIAATREKYQLPETYLLFVGSLQQRKNLDRLLRAWEQVANQDSEIGLAIVGGSAHPFLNPNLDPIPPNVHMIETLNDRELPSLYSGAQTFIMPSLYEGFGLPVLEAMSCGTPVIAANAGALPEVAGKSALLVDPYDINDIASAIDQLVTDQELRNDLASKGLARAGEFSWDRTAMQIKTVLEKAENET